MAKYGDLTLGQTEALVNRLGGKEVVDGILSGDLAVAVTKVAAKLLDFIRTVRVAATSKFIAKDHFAADSQEVKLAWIGNNFKQWFLAKVEEPQAEVTLRYHQLKKNSLDAPILAELRGKAETTLASIWEFLKKQPNGEPGKLLTNGYVNIFYVRDSVTVLRAVLVRWYSDGWRVGAGSVEGLREWFEGYRVFSGNCYFSSA